jgi:succinyl-CoA synthetase beta subunit
MNLERFVNSWLNKKFISPQTCEEGLVVNKILIERYVNYTKEMYFCVYVDRRYGKIAAIISTKGGEKIDGIFEDDLCISRVFIDLLSGAQAYQARELASKVDLNKEQTEQFVDIFLNTIKMLIEKDATLVEINPLVVRSNGSLHCIDSKIEIDSYAHYRQSSLHAIEDTSQIDERIAYAKSKDLTYMHLNGKVGCIVNGTGLANATVDEFASRSCSLANFVDIGGASVFDYKDRIYTACDLAFSHKTVVVVFVNIFAGVLPLNRTIDLITDWLKENNINVPIVMCLNGNGLLEAKEIIADKDIEVIFSSNFKESISTISDLIS